MNATPIDFDDSLYDDAVSGMAFKQQCNKSFKPTAYDLSVDNTIEPNDVWFVKRDFLPEFFSVLPVGCPSVSVVTQHSDFEVDDAVMAIKPSCVKTVFGSNCVSNRVDSTPIPLGLGPPYCPVTPKAQDIKNINTRRERTCLLYVNFRTSTYPLEREYARNKMLQMSRSCRGISVVDHSTEPSSISAYLDQLIDHKFCLCPRGNGIDTHRMWEALYCRTIPIVKRNAAHRNLTDLPILFVDSWDEVTEDFLHSEYDRFHQMKWDYSKLSASWWGRKFRE
jgi:hypothetical protein